ncbi:unnamed protein product [Orchesella dallaii]|uniref:Uncharacterized protein n=1 Tax=Orchesella dallaii TaxID=48710 RepID=A0ABP1RMH3_9HEXA
MLRTRFYWLLALIVLSSALVRTLTIDDSTIDLSKELKVFENCTLNVVLNHVKSVSSSNQSFNLKPLDTPLILLNLLYKLRRKGDDPPYVSMQCGKHCVDLIDQVGYMFIAPPPPKQTCIALVYINPKPCNTWTHNVKTTRFDVTKLLSKNFLNPITSYISRARKVDLRLLKSGMYFVHIEKMRSVGEHHKRNYFDSIAYLMDMLWADGFVIFSRRQGILTKISIGIHYSRLSKAFIPIYTALRVMIDFKQYYTQIEQDCPKENPYLRTRCMIKRRKWLDDESLMTFSISDINIPTDFEKLYMKKTTSITFLIAENAPLNLPNPAYLLDLNEQANDIRQVFVQTLFPNSTILASQDISYVMSEAYPIFAFHASEYMLSEASFTTKSDFMHFVTCYPTKQPGWLSLLGYISAYDAVTWLILVGLAFLSGLFLKREAKALDWMHCFFVFNVLLGQGTAAVKRFKSIGGAWVLAGVVLTFYYQGDNINKLTAPLQPKKLSVFDDLLRSNFTLYSPLRESKSFKTMLDSFKWLGGGRIDSTDIFDNLKLPLFAGLFVKNQISMTKREAEAKIKSIVHMPGSFEEMLEMVKFEFFLGEISKCRETVFVDVANEVEVMKQKLQTRGIDKSELSWSTVPYAAMWYNNWQFQRQPYPDMWLLMRMRSVFQSGLLELWYDWKNRIVAWNDTVALATNIDRSETGLSLNGNLIVVFDLHGVVLAVAVFAFILESLPNIVFNVWLILTLSICLLRKGTYFIASFINRFARKIAATCVDHVNPNICSHCCK